MLTRSKVRCNLNRRRGSIVAQQWIVGGQMREPSRLRATLICSAKLQLSNIIMIVSAVKKEQKRLNNKNKKQNELVQNTQDLMLRLLRQYHQHHQQLLLTLLKMKAHGRGITVNGASTKKVMARQASIIQKNGITSAEISLLHLGKIICLIISKASHIRRRQ